MPAALTRTSNSPGPGVGIGTCSRRNLTSAPAPDPTHAFIRLLPKWAVRRRSVRYTDISQMYHNRSAGPVALNGKQMDRQCRFSLRRLLQAAFGLAAAIAAPSASADPARYPDQPVHIVVPYPAGGSVDFVARVLQPPLQEALGQPVIIDNRGGASGMV